MRRIANALVIALFLAAITLPTVRGLAFESPAVLEGENRRPFDCPELARKTLKFFPAMFEAYFSDHLGYRAELIRCSRTVRLDWLGVSPSPQVVLGENGWLFHDWPGLLDDGRTPEWRERATEWRRRIEARNDWLTGRGIGHVMFLAPDKQTIYPEHLPERLRRKAAAFTPHDALAEELAGTGVRFLDLRPALREGKSVEPMYFDRDTHWTSAGATRADRALLSSTLDHFPGRILWSLGENVEPIQYHCDLAHMLGLPRERCIEPTLLHRPSSPMISRPYEHADLIIGRLPHLPPSVYDNPAVNGPRVVFVHDSFGGEFQLPLAAHCRRLVCVPSHRLPTAVIEREKPDLVIVEMAERWIVAPLPTHQEP